MGLFGIRRDCRTFGAAELDFTAFTASSVSILQDCHELASSKRLAVPPTLQTNHEQRFLMILAPLLHASMRRTNADVMLCSSANLSGGAALYTYFIN